MFNAFEGAPKIVRLWGHGEVLEYGSEKFVDFVKKNEVNTIAGTRAVVVVHSKCSIRCPPSSDPSERFETPLLLRHGFHPLSDLYTLESSMKGNANFESFCSPSSGEFVWV